MGYGAEPQPKSNLVHFSLEIWQLVATIFNDFAENQLTKFRAGFKVGQKPDTWQVATLLISVAVAAAVCYWL